MGVYIMHCERPSDGKLIHYIGYTGKFSPLERLKQHWAGGSKYTRRLRDAGFHFTMGAFWPKHDRKDEVRLKHEWTASDKKACCSVCRTGVPVAGMVHCQSPEIV